MRNEAARIEHISEFLSVYFSHPYWQNIANPRIRFSFLPSAHLREKSAKARVKVSAKELEHFSADSADKIARKILDMSDRGYDCYYFINAVKEQTGDTPAYFTNNEIQKILWVPLDIDRNLHVPINQVFEECGIAPTLVVRTSSFGGFAKLHALLAVEQAESSFEEMSQLCADWADAVGLDRLRDAKRIARIPGTVNWKNGEEAARNEQGQTALLVAETDSIYTHAQMRTALALVPPVLREIAEREKLEKQNAAIERGASPTGASGEFVDWGVAWKNAEQGKWTYSKDSGFRHNALRHWAAQICWEEPTAEVMAARVNFLAANAFEGGYEERADIDKLIRSSVKYLDNAQAAGKLFDEIIEDEYVEKDEEKSAGKSAPESQAKSPAPRTEEGEGGTITNPGADVDSDGSGPGDGESSVRRGSPEQLKNAPGIFTEQGEPSHKENTRTSLQPTKKAERKKKSVDIDYVRFARTIANKLRTEDEHDYLLWLMRFGVAVKRALDKKKGSFDVACGILVSRLQMLGMIRNGVIVAPERLMRTDGREWLRPKWFNKDEQKAFLSETISAVAAALITQHDKLLALPEMNGVKVKLFFPCKSAILTALINGAQNKVILADSRLNQSDDEIIFQNGRYDLVTGEFEDEERSGLEWYQQARWKYANPIACWYRGHEIKENGNGGTESIWSLCPRFRDYLGDTFQGIENLGLREDLIWKVTGYCLIRGNPSQAYFCFVGFAGTGKGVFCEILEGLVGPWNQCRVSFSSLADPWGFGPVDQKTLMIAEEAEETDPHERKDALTAIKRYTGASTVALRNMREDERQVETTAKIILTCNEDLAVNDPSGALLRRMVCLSFKNTRARNEQNNRLSRDIVDHESDYLASHAASKLSGAIRAVGTAMLFEDRDGVEALIEGRERTIEAMDPVGSFVESCIEAHTGYRGELGAGFLVEFYRIIAKLARLSRPGGQLSQHIKEAMRRRGMEQTRIIRGVVYYARINLAALENRYAIDRDMLRNALRESPIGHQAFLLIDGLSEADTRVESDE